MSEKFDVRGALTTDKHALDEEWVRQPRLMDKVTLALSDVKYQRDRAEARFSYAKGKLAMRVRAKPEDYNIEGNVTDAKVKEVVRCDDDLYELEKKLHEWEAELVAADGLRWAVGQRKPQLQDLARLYLAGYFSSPYISNEEREKIENIVQNEQEDALKSNVRMRKRAEKKE